MIALFPSIEGFVSLAHLGGGGMGNVYLAREQGLYGFEKLWAVKLIRPSMEERSEFRAMFMDEARLMARLHHPAIPQIHRFGEADDLLYMVMEYVAGESFAAILGSGQPLIPPLIACSLIAKVCRGLHTAHELTDASGGPMNVVHRDVSPSNLVLTYDGGVKILDFGIALMRERRAPVTGAGVVKGKPSYLAPEQFYHRATDRRADIFSVSIVLWELLTRKRLIDTLDLAQHGFERTLEQAVFAPSRVAGSLPLGLDELVLRGLATDPDHRFETAREMARELEVLVEREGCEPLEEFAERELEPLRSAHDTRVRALRSANGAPAPWQPPPITQIESDPGGVEAGTQPTRAEKPLLAETSLSSRGSPPRRWRGAVVLLVVMAVLASSWLLLGAESEPAIVPVAAAPPPAPPPREEPTPPPPPEQPVVPEPRAKIASSRSSAATKQRARRVKKSRSSKAAKENSPQKKRRKGLISEW